MCSSIFLRAAAAGFLILAMALATPTPSAAGEREVFISEERMATLIARSLARTEPTSLGSIKIVEAAFRALGHQPSPPPVFYIPTPEQDKVEKIKRSGPMREDSRVAFEAAIAYRILGKKESAEKAVEVIMAWVNDVEVWIAADGGPLLFALYFPYMIFAADLLEDSPYFSAEDQAALEEFLATDGISMSDMYEFDNNHGSWGMFLEAAIGAYLNDQAILDRVEDRYKEFIEIQMNEDGDMIFEVTRRDGRGNLGISYTHTALAPNTMTAEILRLQGRDVYDYVSPSGHSLRLAFERAIPWVEDPESFPYYLGDDINEQMNVGRYGYWEILNQRWPDETAQRLLVIQRPFEEDYLTFTHGELRNDDGSVDHWLAVSTTGGGAGTVTSSPAGIDCGSDCDEWYAESTVVDLVAAPDVGFSFVGWSGDADCSDGTITMTSDFSCTATFEVTQRTLAVTRDGNGTGTVTSDPVGIDCGVDCDEMFDDGTVVTLTATPEVGSIFVGWSGDADCSDGSVTLTTDLSCNATFDLERHSVGISKEGTGSGTVTSSPAGIDCGADCEADYDHGTVVTLSATPDAGSVFVGWGGAPDCFDGVLDVTGDRGCIATFDLQ